MAIVLAAALLVLAACGLTLFAAAAPAPATAALAAPTAGTRLYQYTDAMLVDLEIVRLHGLMGQAARGDFGGKADIRVSDGLVVTGVPVDFLKAVVRSEQQYVFATSQAAVPAAAAAAPKGRLDAARGIVGLWVKPLLAKYAESTGAAAGQPLPKPPLAELARFDCRRQLARDAREGKPPAVLAADWLFFVKRMELEREPPYAPKWQQREVSLRELLDRFEPDTPVTAANADAVAEELVWTKALGLGDGTPRTLALARFVLQALILEAVDGEIGDPGEADLAKAGAAIKKLEKVKAGFCKQWDAAAKQAPPAAAAPAPAAPAAKK
jgi:hypothetical protein